MPRTKVLLAAALPVILSGFHSAKAQQDLAKENTELRQRVENLEEQVQKLAKTTPPAPKDAANKKPMWSQLDVQFYGYIKADSSYDTSRTYPGNYVLWAESEATNKNDNEFNLTANETRLGMMLKGPENPHLQTTGRVEFDFYGDSAITGANKAKIQMRHAYLQLTWPDDRFSILAGQTSDVFSPLAPPTLNYTVLWDAGNIGYRRPQIRLTKNISLDKDIGLELQGALARTIGRDVAVPGVTSESGEDAGFPCFQARAALTFPSLSDKPTTLGLSGHFAVEEYDTATNGTNKHFESWSLNLDLTQPVNGWFSLKGELFAGKNLETYFGGIGQGVRPVKDPNGVIINHANEIAAAGGWIAASLGPWDKWRFNFGAGIDDVDSEDVNAGARTLNNCIFGNSVYSFNQHAEVGLELSHWRTDYLGPGDADSLRAQLSLTYRF